jgi:hypothetical protein
MNCHYRKAAFFDEAIIKGAKDCLIHYSMPGTTQTDLNYEQKSGN